MSSREPKTAGGIPIRNVRTRTLSKKSKKKKYIVIGVVAFLILVTIIGNIVSNAPRNYYVKDIQIAPGTITQLATEDGKCYVKVNVKGFFFSEDNSWVEVENSFYQSALLNINKDIGVLLNNSDVYKKKYLGLFGDKGQTFEKDIWTIENVYPTFADASNAFPNKKFNAQAVILKKKITKRGDYFFIVDSDSKKMTVQIDKAIFDKYNVSDKVNCEFESIGDFTKLVKVATDL